MYLAWIFPDLATAQTELRYIKIMQAIQPAIPPIQPEKGDRRLQSRKTRTQRSSPYQAIAMETVAKLATNLVLSVCAASALVQLLPYHRSVQEKLREIQGEVKLTQVRVDRVRTDFNHNFDPAQAKSIMQEQTNRVDSQQRPVVWVEKNSADANE
ncbi:MULTISPECIES: hypothetical protein [Kamptonema]|uniref:slr1601 family putative cell division protein n=1 Tax=Kamptonema TaxID=1501433 RepID=UPI001F2702FF|nr:MULTISPECIES: hypothetical protein [Kamptonema]